MNRLIREDNRKLGRTYTYEYDTNGNRLNKGKHDFTLDSDLPTGTNITYLYDGDQQVQMRTESGNGTMFAEFVYDDVGNPKVYRGTAMRWDRVRNLTSVDHGRITFTYNADNLRIGKKTGNRHTEFYYDDSRLLAEKRSLKTKVAITVKSRTAKKGIAILL